MEEKSLVSLGEDIVNKLALMLDRSTCGWRQLASMVSEHPKFRFSENELTSCSLQVLRPTGSPGRAVLAVLADRFCSLNVLLDCLRKIDHQEAVQYLTSSVAEIQISVQPQSQQAAVGSRVSLTCRAFGPPDLNYQWFRGKEEILGEKGTSPELILCPLAPVHQGHYICRINNGIKCIFSQWAHISVIRSADCSSSLLTGSVSGLFITSHPQSQVVSEGDTLFLECNALANPPAQYRWHHNMVPMEEEKSRLLQIPCLTTAHRGQYRCKIFNLYHEAWTDAATITIGPSSITDASWIESSLGQEDTMTISEHKIQHSTNRTPLAKQFYATDKIALLIGNMNYIHHTQLCAPIADVHELTNLLTQMDFKVVSLLDLNWQEMHSAVTEFLLLLDKGVYGLLYFAGHGYENYGNSFMVPIDAPASYTSEHCVCVQSILTRMQEKQTGLNIFLLDMCRKRNPNDDIVVLPGLIKVTANIVFGYATCVDAEAYEVKREDVTNGIFISFLKRRVCEDEKVTVMLDRVAEDMGRFEITRGRQALELRSNLSERRSLTDPIMTPENCSASSSARNLQWAVAHVLPQSLCLQFDCGVKVQLGFAAEFSNVMVIYTRILEKPKEVSSCCAQLTDFPEDVDVHMKKSNQESLLEAGSLLINEENLSSPEGPSLYTRVRSLQRLKNEFTFTTCLHYNYSHMNEEVQERQTVTVGKPLVSKLNLHEPRPSFSASSFICRDSLEFARCSSITEDLISAGSNACPHSAETDKKHQTDADFPYSSIGSNTPVETEASEIVDAPQPLVTGKSLPHNQINDTNYNFSDIYGFHSY
ncbi:MALT paracaspase 2 isoform X1 [Takifugu rubripes]|uniref:MALT paracaspase 2 n=2 Tax=Takifugu rubripes TaxID=31033 RepID=A0A674NUN5_TAKRU|nr:mucosa-associated lymphoid tissue lymphoma translocation protein 1-like isoform X1 [Takifugu rubripes]|eukprot:XP_011613098.1 PREDICTED: mucosa-associated lymphoid tissue lymphoma translocation protein 1-like isoform X2 [Takifugu rubripes]